MMRIFIVIPAFEAGDRAIRVAREAAEQGYGVVLIDDGSTCPLALPSDLMDRVILLRHERNRGVGAAILSGYRVARKCGGDVGVVMAGDGQMAIEDIPTMIGPILDGQADYVKGERFSHRDCEATMPSLRFAGNCCLTFLTRLLLNRWTLLDAQCGFTALRLSWLEQLPLEFIYPRYGFPNDFLAALDGAGARIAEVTVCPCYQGEPSGLKPVLAMVVYPFVLARAAIMRALLLLRRSMGRPATAGGST